MESEPILVADDNAVDRMILVKIIRDQGYEVIEAHNGAEALELYHERQPQIVLLDALMPKMDGFEVARRIKADATKRFTPVIFLTALTEAAELARCLDAGGDDFLSKPYNRTILQAKLSALRRVRDLHLTTELQRDAIERNNQRLIQEQEAAKAIFDRIAHREYLEADCIRYLMSPIALFNGDVLLAAPTPRRTLNLLLGDFTGHGLTASVGAMPLADSFYALTQHGLSLSDVASECNRKLNSVLPAGYFCCALLAEINFDKGVLEYWSGGLPTGYVIARQEQSGSDTCNEAPAAQELASRHLPLGILSADRFDPTTQHLSVTAGERLVLCTDGVVEAVSPKGEQFGDERVLEVLKRAVSQQACTVTALQTALAAHCEDSVSTDDITAVELTIVPPDSFDLVPAHPALEYETSPRQWQLSYEVRDDSLADFSPFPLLQRILLGTPGLRGRMSEIGMVVTELYSNALEHGVLRLESKLKRDASGFAQYYRARSEALRHAQGFVRFDLTCREQAQRVVLEISVTDSGPGFATLPEPANDEHHAADRIQGQECESSFHGRGIGLLREICQRVEHLNQGRTTKVELVCDSND